MGALACVYLCRRPRGAEAEIAAEMASSGKKLALPQFLCDAQRAHTRRFAFEIRVVMIQRFNAKTSRKQELECQLTREEERWLLKVLRVKMQRRHVALFQKGT